MPGSIRISSLREAFRRNRKPVLVTGILVLLFLLWPGLFWHRGLPDFASIHEPGERKAAFFKFLYPFIRDANREILAERNRLAILERKLALGPMSRRDRRWYDQMLETYGLDEREGSEPTHDDLEALLLRVDIIPPSLALAQAALESGWGTSRYAREGNNLFGIWCYTPGCGLVPRKRPPGEVYEVASYPTPEHSFLDYIQNLNANPAYDSIWYLRRNLRQSGDVIDGTTLAEGLFNYSGEGWGYVTKVKRVIQANSLEPYDSLAGPQ